MRKRKNGNEEFVVYAVVKLTGVAKSKELFTSHIENCEVLFEPNDPDGCVLHQKIVCSDLIKQLNCR